MSRWSSGRGQTEPTVALVALFAVCLGLTLYSGVFAGALPESGRDTAAAASPRVRDAVVERGVLDPRSLADGVSAGPTGYEVNLSVRAADQRWDAGPTPPPSADSTSEPVSVQVGSGRIEPGRLRVVVWR